MIPINNAATASSVATATVERHGDASQTKVATATVTETEADNTQKTAQSTKVVKEADKVQAKPRDEERAPDDQSKGRTNGRGSHTDIQV